MFNLIIPVISNLISNKPLHVFNCFCLYSNILIYNYPHHQTTKHTHIFTKILDQKYPLTLPASAYSTVFIIYCIEELATGYHRSARYSKQERSCVN